VSPAAVIPSTGRSRFSSRSPNGSLLESLSAEIAPFGIHTTIVNPGFFRTEFLTEHSTNYAAPSIADYDERRGPSVEYVAGAEQKLLDLKAQIESNRTLSTSLAFD
jgi:short-subunit dehydrogenase